jgi:ABC-2 type transport system permease protein
MRFSEVLNLVLLKKCLHEVRLLFAACFALVFAFCFVRVFIVASLELIDFAAIVERLWDKWEKFAPVPLSHLLSYPGRIGIGYDEPIVWISISIFAIARGSDAVSGELNRGTLEMLLAQPVSRLQVLYSQALVTLGCLALLSLASWGGTWLGIQCTTVEESLPPPRLKLPLFPEIPIPFQTTEKVEVPMRTKVDPVVFLPGALNLFCLGCAVAGISTLISACDRYRWRTIGIVASLFVISMIFKIVGLAFESFGWLRALSLFTAYEPQKFIFVAVQEPSSLWNLARYGDKDVFLEPGPLGYNLILLGIALVCYLGAGIVFHKRDLPAPL